MTTVMGLCDGFSEAQRVIHMCVAQGVPREAISLAQIGRRPLLATCSPRACGACTWTWARRVRASPPH
jgi:hypothetical protein